MKFPTVDLRETFAVVDKVEPQVGMQSSQFVHLNLAKGKLNMAMCGLVVSESNCNAEGTMDSFFADRRVLGAFLGSCRGVVVDITVKENQMTLKSGRQQVVLTGMSEISGYGKWQPNGKLPKLALTDELRKELSMLSQYAPITAASDHLSAVYLLKSYGILATDMFAIAACLDSSIDSTVPLPIGLAKLAGKLDARHFQVDKEGAGIQLPRGYLYQALSTRLKEFPLKAVRGLLDGAKEQPTVASFKASDLLHGLTHLRQFIFGGSGEDAVVEVNCTPEQTTFTLQMAQGTAHCKVPTHGKLTKPVKLKWLLNPMLPWVEYVAGEEEAIVQCTQADGNHGFRSKHKSKQYILILADKG